MHDVCALQVVNVVSSYGLPWQNSFAIIVLLYFYSHYLFASGAAHIGAMYTAFLSVAIACGTPGLLAAVALGQVSAPLNPNKINASRCIALHDPWCPRACSSGKIRGLQEAWPTQTYRAIPVRVE